MRHGVIADGSGPARVRSRRYAVVVLAVVLLMSVAGCGSGSANLALPKAVAGGVVGVLFVDRNHDGKHEDGEPALGNWEVGIYGTGPLPLAETKTDAQGRFHFTNIKGLVGDTATLKYAPHIVAPGAFDNSISDLHLHYAVHLGTSLAVPVDDYRLCTQLKGCGVRLPDLTPVLQVGDTPDPDFPGTKDWYLDTTTEPGHVLLRFAAMTANIGTGLLQFTALKPPSNAATQPVQQRLYGDHTVYVHTAGDFVYHPSHHHFHINNFETYQLRPAGSPNVVASGTKVSFCLTDNASNPDRPVTAAPVLTLDLPPMSCGTREQGISAGFTDYYGPKLPDQWIDVTSVPSGDYDLVLSVDPDNFIIESNDANNTVSFPLHYTNPLQ